MMIASALTWAMLLAAAGQDIRPEELWALEHDFKKTLQEKEVVKLQVYLPTGGTVLGIDGPKISKGILTKELQSRTGIYCMFFDSECYTHEIRKNRLSATSRQHCSYHQIVNTPGRFTIKTFSHREGAYIKLVSDHIGGCEPTDTTFVFSRKGKKWKLEAVEYL
jgi:hypothetical protein